MNSSERHEIEYLSMAASLNTENSTKKNFFYYCKNPQVA